MSVLASRRSYSRLQLNGKSVIVMVTWIVTVAGTEGEETRTTLWDVGRRRLVLMHFANGFISFNPFVSVVVVVVVLLLVCTVPYVPGACL